MLQLRANSDGINPWSFVTHTHALLTIQRIQQHVTLDIQQNQVQSAIHSAVMNRN